MRRQLGKREGGRQFGIGSRFAEGLGVRPEKRRSEQFTNSKLPPALSFPPRLGKVRWHRLRWKKCGGGGK